MKKTLLLLFAIAAQAFYAQPTMYLMGTYWTGTNEKSALVNTSNWAVNTLTTLAGVKYIGQGITAYDPVSQIYFNYTDHGSPLVGLTKVDAQTGAVLGSINTPYFFKGIEYNANTGNLVGSYWTGSVEIFASLDVTTGALNSLASLPAMWYAMGESTFDPVNNRYFNKTDIGIQVIDAATGGTLAIFPHQNLKGIEYNVNTGKLIGTFWTGSQEVFATMDLTNGNVNTIAVLSGVSSLMQGESAFDPINNHYYNNTDLGITQIDAVTGAILGSTMSSIKGIEFVGPAPACIVTPTLLSPQTVYAQTGSNATFNVATMPGVTYQWQSNPNNFGWMNVPSNATYVGGNTSVLTVNNVGLSNHLQPFRVVVSTRNCTGTSATSVIHISDTCITESSDTLEFEIRNRDTDTRAVISVFPNPTTEYLMIDIRNEGSIEGYSIQLLSALGRVVYHERVTGPSQRVDLQALSAKGLYILQVLDGNGETVESKRIVVR